MKSKVKLKRAIQRQQEMLQAIKDLGKQVKEEKEKGEGKHPSPIKEE